MLPQRIDLGRRLDLETSRLDRADQRDVGEPALAREAARGGAGDAVIVDAGARHAGVEAQAWREPPAEIAADGPAVAPQAAAQQLRRIIEPLVAAERAKQEVR